MPTRKRTKRRVTIWFVNNPVVSWADPDKKELAVYDADQCKGIGIKVEALVKIVKDYEVWKNKQKHGPAKMLDEVNK